LPDLTIKKIKKHEVSEAVSVYHTSRVDMQTRLGQNPENISDKEKKQALVDYIHIHDTGIFYGAFVNGQISGISNAVIRNDIWFLSGFWVLPDFQNKGIGKPLLERIYQEGVKSNVNKFCVWSSLDPSAQTCYLKKGMMPGHPVYRLAGTIKSFPRFNPDYKLETLDINAAAKIDSVIRGSKRILDHEYWLENGHKGYQVMLETIPVGYFYCKNGVVGAGGWIMEEAGKPTTLLALKQASIDSGTVSITPGGLNHAAIEISLSLGLRVSGGAHFLTTKSFGLPGQYLSSGPLLH